MGGFGIRSRLLLLGLRACSSNAYAMRPFPLTATSASPDFPPPVVWLGRDDAALLMASGYGCAGVCVKRWVAKVVVWVVGVVR